MFRIVYIHTSTPDSAHFFLSARDTQNKPFPEQGKLFSRENVNYACKCLAYNGSDFSENTIVMLQNNL